MSFFFQKSTWGAAKKSKASAPTSAAAFNANAAVSASASATATATALPTGPAFDWAAFAARAVAELPDDYARRFCKNFEDKSCVFAVSFVLPCHESISHSFHACPSHCVLTTAPRIKPRKLSPPCAISLSSTLL